LPPGLSLEASLCYLTPPQPSQLDVQASPRLPPFAAAAAAAGCCWLLLQPLAAAGCCCRWLLLLWRSC